MAPIVGLVGLEDPAPEHNVIITNLLPSHGQAEAIQLTEATEIRALERHVRHVEVVPVGSVRIPIIGRPRPLARARRAFSYTLNCEEPVQVCGEGVDGEGRCDGCCGVASG